MSDSEIVYSPLSGVEITDEISEVVTGNSIETVPLGKQGGVLNPALNLQFKESIKNLNLYDEALVKEFSKIPDKMGFKIGEVAELVDIKQYVLRYWESEFEALKPKKSKSNQRMYTRKDVEMVMMIKKLLYRDKFSINGARKALKTLKSQRRENKKWDNMAIRYKNACYQMEGLISDIRDIRQKLFS